MSRTRQLTMIALFPALMGATAGISIPLFGLPPITLQTFFVFLAALVLGPKNGALSMIIYLIIGAIGVPVFAGWKGGLGIIMGSSGGFLIGFIIATYFIGTMVKSLNKEKNNFVAIFMILLGGNLIIYLLGATYMSILTETNIALVLGYFPPFFIGDFIKIIATLYVYSRIRSVVTYV